MNAVNHADFDLDFDLPALSGIEGRADFYRDEIASLSRHIAETRRHEKSERARLAEERKVERARHAEAMRELAEAEEDFRTRVKSMIAEAETMIASDRDALKRLEA
jgi:hypothetical protein